MAVHLDLRENLLDFPGGVNDERRALDAEDRLSVQILLLQDAVGRGHFSVHVAEQGEGKVVFRLEFFLGRGRIGADPNNGRSQFLKLAECIAEPACFRRSAGRVGLGKKEEDQRMSSEVVELHRAVLLVRQFKGRRRFSNLQHDSLPLFATEAQRKKTEVRS